MLWLKVKRATSAESHSPERDPEKKEDAQSSEIDETEYPGLAVTLPTVLSVCLAVFLTALVSPSAQSESNL